MVRKDLDEIVDLSFQLREQCITSVRNLAGQFDESEDAPPISAFNMVHNEATITIELLHYYNSVWRIAQKISAEERDRAKEENAQRVMMVTARTFISSLSDIEYVTKLALKGHANLLSIDWGQRVYLGKVLEKSNAARWIDDDMARNMKDLLFVRNCLVHNNGVSDEDRKLFHPADKPLEAKIGQVIQSDLKLLLEYTCYACYVFESWSESFLNNK